MIMNFKDQTTKKQINNNLKLNDNELILIFTDDDSNLQDYAIINENNFKEKIQNLKTIYLFFIQRNSNDIIWFDVVDNSRFYCIDINYNPKLLKLIDILKFIFDNLPFFDT